MTRNELLEVDQAADQLLCPLMNVVDVAEILGLARKTVNKLVRARKLGCVQISSRERRFTREQVKAYIDSVEVAVPIDRKNPDRVKSAAPKGGEKSSRVFNRADLLKEIRSWQ